MQLVQPAHTDLQTSILSRSGHRIVLLATDTDCTIRFEPDSACTIKEQARLLCQDATVEWRLGGKKVDPDTPKRPKRSEEELKV
jgi:hypothetical protein